VGELIQLLLPTKLVALLLKPFVRLIISLVAVPLCRLFLHRVVRKKDLDAELERDIALWLRGSLVLLIATANMESFFFGWVSPEFRDEKVWLIAFRLMAAISVIEGMPDQALFAIIHPGPPKPEIDWRRPWSSFRAYTPKFLYGLMCQHFNRSSPVLAIMTVFFRGPIGWICYGLAITNYLIIGLVSSKDRALDVLTKYDRAVAERRKELVEELVPLHPDLVPELTPEQQVLAAEAGGPFAPDVATDGRP
jgi:hypothetical protein